MNDQSGVASISVPTAHSEGEPLSLIIDQTKGVVVGSRRGRVEVLGAVEGYRGRSALGVALGASGRQLQAAYGLPRKREEIAGGEVWAYGTHGPMFLVIGDRVHSWWLTKDKDG